MQHTSVEELQAEMDELRQQLFEANEALEAIRTGQIDALIVEGEKGSELYTLKTADQAYRVFIENMSEGAVTLNQEGIVLYSNSQFASLVAQPLSTVIGVPFFRFIALEDEKDYEQFFKDCWTSDCKLEVLLTAGDATVPVQLSLTALQMETGLALSVIITDLSVQKKTQQQLEETNHRLAETNAALSLSNHDLQQFASVASHDLQEPLRKIQMFSNLLLTNNDKEFSTGSKKYLDKISESARRMKALIIDVLNYSKLSAHDNEFVTVNLNEIVAELLEDFELLVQESGAVVNAGEMPCIEANRGQMRQVFQNLLSNALKFTKKGQAPLIAIQSHRLRQKSFSSAADESGPFVLISIKDNGIGFDEKYGGQIFALFERLHSKDIYEGTGIGLAITKKIIEKHNGLVSVKSRPGDGAEFLLLLPVNEEK